MLKKTAIGSLLIAILIVLISCKAKIPINPELEEKIMFSEEKVTWGYGCGPHCSFNSDGSLTSSISFHDFDKSLMKTAGQYMNVIHYPSSFILEAKKWKYDYEGTWQTLDEQFRVKLALINSECTIQRSEGKKKKSLPCEKLPKTKDLTCRFDKMLIQGVSKHVFICADEENTETIFGIEKPITKVVVGEPSIKTYFYTTKRNNE